MIRLQKNRTADRNRRGNQSICRSKNGASYFESESGTAFNCTNTRRIILGLIRQLIGSPQAIKCVKPSRNKDGSNGTTKRVGMGTLLIAQILILSMAVQETKPIMPSENMLEKQQHQGFLMYILMCVECSERNHAIDLVLVVDWSGSMNENNRIGEVQKE